MRASGTVLRLLILALAALLAGCRPAAQAQIPTPGLLPSQMKGFELYSWEQDGEWRFTLISGTNRLKELEEIKGDTSQVTGDGWVNLKAVGMEPVKQLLSRVPPGETVIWMGPQGLGGLHGNSAGLSLPPGEVVAELQEYSQELGIQMQTTR
jgi:hypothetical protein